MVTRILLFRHAQSAAPERILGYETDLDLSPFGMTQAEKLAEILAATEGDRIGAVLSSGMLRARHTALPIARGLGKELRLVPELHERKMGAFSGLVRATVGEEYRESHNQWMAGRIDHTQSGGESYRDVQSRVVPVFERLAREAVGTTVVVVTHGIVIRVLLTSLLPEFPVSDFERIGITCAALNEMIYFPNRNAFHAARVNQSLDGVPQPPATP